MSSPSHFTNLREKLDLKFSLDDFNLLCHDLTMDPNRWPPAGKETKIQNLLEDVTRTGRMNELLARLRELRPNETWLAPNSKAESGDPLTDYRRQHCIARWSDDRYQLDKNFVRLILLRKDEQRGFVQPEGAHEYNDLRDLLADTPDRAIILLGAPGSGKSTLLRRLQMDEAQDRLSDKGSTLPLLSFFVPLNEYPENATDPRMVGAALGRCSPGVARLRHLAGGGPPAALVGCAKRDAPARWRGLQTKGKPVETLCGRADPKTKSGGVHLPQL